MDRSATPLRIVLGCLAVVVVVLLGFLLAQAARPTIKDPRPLNGTTLPKGEVTITAEVFGEANLREVLFRLNGRAIDPVIVAHSARHWTVKYQAVLPQGRYQAELTAIDQRGREQPYSWSFTATGPASAPQFADPLPRNGTRLAAGEALISIASFSDTTPVKTVTLTINGQPLVTANGRLGKGERTIARHQRALTPGNYTARAESTDAEGATSVYEWTFTVLEAGQGEPDAHFFPETGYYVYTPFIAYWAQHGGLAMYGLPITPEFEQNELTVQWFERARFEKNPKLPAENQVQFGLLGNEMRKPDPPLPGPPGGNRRFFPETGHSIGGRFRDYWEKNGGLTQFGYPLTEEVFEDGLTVQWFERARFEYHPEHAGSAAEVQLSQLGRILWGRQNAR